MHTQKHLQRGDKERGRNAEALEVEKSDGPEHILVYVPTHINFLSGYTDKKRFLVFRPDL